MEALIDSRAGSDDAVDPGRCRARAAEEELSPGDWRRLFGELASGEATAFERLYDLMATRLYGLALWRTGRAEDAADVVHDTFVRVAEQRDRLAAVRHPRAWLMTVANRIAIDHLRRERRRQAEPLEEHGALVLEAEEPGRRLDARRASRALAELPRAQRDAVLLRYFGPCTFAEIGAIVGVSVFTAASRYRLGLRKLRRLLEVSP
jgi:RNA polymerase sigma-70 factor (ECF subfamily)